jgi:thioredoxin-like negative regulator of GroEL
MILLQTLCLSSSEVGKEIAGRLKLMKVDARADGGLAARFGVQYVPAPFLFQRGEVVVQQTVGGNKCALLGWLDVADIR